MAKKKLRLRIVTPFAIKVDEEVDMVILRCFSGDWGVLPGHSPYSAVLKYDIMRMKHEDEERTIVVYGGIASVRDNVLTVLTSEAEWPGEIDLIRAQTNRENAEKRLREQKDDVEMLYDQVRIRRALVQLDVGTRSIETETEEE